MDKKLTPTSLLSLLTEEKEKFSKDEVKNKDKLRKLIFDGTRRNIAQKLIRDSLEDKLSSLVSEELLVDIIKNNPIDGADGLIASYAGNRVENVLEAFEENKKKILELEENSRKQVYKNTQDIVNRTHLKMRDAIPMAIKLTNSPDFNKEFAYRTVTRIDNMRRIAGETLNMKEFYLNIFSSIIDGNSNSEKTKKQEETLDIIRNNFRGEIKYKLIEKIFSNEAFSSNLDNTIVLLNKYSKIRGIKRVYEGNLSKSQREKINNNIETEINGLLNLLEFSEVSELMDFYAFTHSKGKMKNVFKVLNKNTNNMLKEERKIFLSTIISELPKLKVKFPEDNANNTLEKLFNNSADYILSLGPNKKRKMFKKWIQSIDNLTNLKNIEHIKGFTSNIVNPNNFVLNKIEDKLIYGKMASFFGKSGYNILLTNNNFIRKIDMPNILKNTILLPEQVSIYDEQDLNKKTLESLIYLQASTSRFGNFPFEDEIEFYSQFEDVELAKKIFSILTYRRNINEVSEKFPKIKNLIEILKKGVETSCEYKNDYTRENEGILDNLEKKIIFGIDMLTPQREFSKRITQEMNLEDFDEDKILLYLTDIYNSINIEKGGHILNYVKSNSNKSIKKTRNFENEKNINISYTDNNIFYYEEASNVNRVTLIEKKANSAQNEKIIELRKEHGSEIERLLNVLMNEMPQRVQIERRVYDGEIDEALLVEAMIEKKRGGLPDENIYTNRVIRERDVNVLLTIDQSKFLSRRENGKRLSEHVKLIALYLSEALNKTGDEYSIVGHNSRGPDEVFYNTFKGFEEEYTNDTENALGLISPLQNSRTGTIYRHVAQEFGKRSAKKKIHFDLMTNLPKDKLYENEIVVEDMINAARRERASGINLFGICFDNNLDKKILERIYGRGHFMIVSEIEKVPSAIIDAYRLLTF